MVGKIQRNPNKASVQHKQKRDNKKLRSSKSHRFDFIILFIFPQNWHITFIAVYAEFVGAGRTSARTSSLLIICISALLQFSCFMNPADARPAPTTPINSILRHGQGLRILLVCLLTACSGSLNIHTQIQGTGRDCTG